MKKLFLSCVALLSIVLFSACESKDSVSAKAEGTYMTHRTTNMVNLPPNIPFTPVEENVSVNIKAATDTHVNITIPSMSYVFGGENKTIQDFTISNIPVLDAGEEGVVIANHKFIFPPIPAHFPLFHVEVSWN